jgi:hypothetical protein
VRDIKQSHYSAAISANIILSVPLFVFFVIFALVMRIIVSVLVERVLDAFVEDLFSVLWSIRPFRARNCVVQPKFIQKRREIVRMILEFKFLVKEMLYLLFLPWLTLAEAFKKLLLFGFIKLRGRVRPRSSV